MEYVTFNVSNDNPSTKKLVEWGSFLSGLMSRPTITVSPNMFNQNLTGWVPYRILEKYHIIEKGMVDALYRLFEGDLLLENIYPQLTPDYTPFNGVQLEEKTVDALARIYDCDAKREMRPYLHRYFVTLRNLFWGLFGEAAHNEF